MLQEEVYFGNRILWKKKESDGGNKEEDQENFPNPGFKEEDSADGGEASMPCEYLTIGALYLAAVFKCMHPTTKDFFDTVFNFNFSVL